MAKLQHMCLCECDHPPQIKTILLNNYIITPIVGALGFEPRVSRTRIVNVAVTLCPGIFTPYQALLWFEAMTCLISYYLMFFLKYVLKYDVSQPQHIDKIVQNEILFLGQVKIQC